MLNGEGAALDQVCSCLEYTAATYMRSRIEPGRTLAANVLFALSRSINFLANDNVPTQTLLYLLAHFQLTMSTHERWGHGLGPGDPRG